MCCTPQFNLKLSQRLFIKAGCRYDKTQEKEGCGKVRLKKAKHFSESQTVTNWINTQRSNPKDNRTRSGPSKVKKSHLWFSGRDSPPQQTLPTWTSSEQAAASAEELSRRLPACSLAARVLGTRSTALPVTGRHSRTCWRWIGSCVRKSWTRKASTLVRKVIYIQVQFVKKYRNFRPLRHTEII